MHRKEFSNEVLYKGVNTKLEHEEVRKSRGRWAPAEYYERRTTWVYAKGYISKQEEVKKEVRGYL